MSACCSAAVGHGAEHADSDVDLGPCYRLPPAVDALRGLAAELGRGAQGDGRPDVTKPGGWGPWVDGDGWLSIDGTPVDWIYRDLDRVRRSVVDAQAGRVDFGFQVGHPLRVSTVAYAGELALGRVLVDPPGELAALQAELTVYPPALRQAFVDRLWEKRFLLGAVQKPVGRGDATYVAGMLFGVVTLCAYAAG